MPILLGLQASFRGCCTRIRIIDEHNAMADEDVVFNLHTLANEGVTRYLAAPADSGVLLNFNERPYLGFVADFTSVQVDELRELDPLAKLYVRGNTAEFAHRRIISPLLRIDSSAASSIRTMRKPACPSLKAVLLFSTQSAK